MAIFNSYVSLPEGNQIDFNHLFLPETVPTPIVG
jgi:hypothetical protein